MLPITDIAGNTELLTNIRGLTRNRKVNGEKSLAFFVISDDSNAHSFGMVDTEAIIELDGEEYVIKTVSEKNAGVRSIKEVGAVHKFFCDLMDGYQYDKQSGSMTFIAALDFVFSGTGYTYTIMDSFNANTFGDVGDDNRLALFQKVLEAYGAEFYVNGTQVYLKKEIGNKTDFQFRYAHNVKTIDKKVDSSDLATYIKGFGKQNEDGTYVAQAEYTSPNADVLGIRHAPAVRDERYTDNASLLARIQSDLKDEPDLSITIDFTDLRASGYTYEQPNEGDYGFIIYEPMNLDIEARIVEIKEEFDANLEPIKTSVTLSNLREGLTDVLTRFSQTSKQLGRVMSGQETLPYSVLDAAVKSATEALQSAQTELEFNNGIIARAKDNPNHLVLFNSSGIGVSLDGGATFRTAMTSDGFVADLITVGTMKFDRLQGGSIKVGDPYVNGDMQVWADNNDDGQPDIIGRIDYTGAYFPYIKSDNFVGNVVNKYKNYATETYYFDCDNGIDSNDGLTTSTAKANMQAFINRLPKDLNGSTITLRGKGQFVGNIIVDGFRNGILVIADWDGTNIYGLNGVWASYNDCVLVLQNINIWGPGGNGNAIVNIHNCKFFKADTVSLFGGPSQSHGFFIESSKFFITGCQVYDLTDRGLYAYGVSQGYVVNGKGSAPYSIVADEGSIVTGAGSRWDGSLVRWSNALLGTVDSSNTGWIIDPWYVDTGSTAPAPPAQSATQTLTIQPSTGDNWSTSGYWENDSVKQGSWGYGDRYGLWYFDLSAIKGKTIDSATITLSRNGGGTNAARTIYFRTHNYTSRSGRPGGAPAMSAVGATGSIAVGQTASFDIKAMLQSNIASGSDRSIGIYAAGSTDYMSVSAQPTLTITYH